VKAAREKKNNEPRCWLGKTNVINVIKLFQTNIESNLTILLDNGSTSRRVSIVTSRDVRYNNERKR